MTAKDVTISRDFENDILYVLKNGINLKSITNIPVNEDITLRIIKEKNEVVGFIIDQFSLVCPTWKDSAEYALMEYFDEIFDVVNDECKRRLTQQASSAAFA